MSVRQLVRVESVAEMTYSWTLSAHDVSKGEEVDDKDEGIKHQTLRNAMGQRSNGGRTVVDIVELLSV